MINTPERGCKLKFGLPHILYAQRARSTLCTQLYVSLLWNKEATIL